ncbi:MAG: SDR family NAD(P)-dependent oxidoreductase [Armatimonadetes bacterium]|nr:SDR family NAD(P)-dependent oxidoreductase [Armatimonadota bacterium]
MHLNDRHIVITGGTGGLGTTVVQAFLEAGAVCHVPTSRPPLRPRPRHERLRLVPDVDLTDEAAVITFYEDLPDLWASIHLAGGFAMGPITETTLADFQAQFELNAVTCFLCCREAVRVMREKSAGGAPGGRIVNVASRPALAPTGGMIAYSASKAAVASITQSLAEEVKGEGILVNAVVPSIIDTPANRAAIPDANHDLWPKPEQIAETILFLASPGNALTSGALVPVYGQA